MSSVHMAMGVLIRENKEMRAEIERLRENECKQHNEITKLMREIEQLRIAKAEGK